MYFSNKIHCLNNKIHKFTDLRQKLKSKKVTFYSEKIIYGR